MKLQRKKVIRLSQQRRFVKYFLLIFSPWAIALCVFFTYLYLSEIEKVHALRLASERLNVNMGKQAIHQEFQMVMSDLLILAEHNAFYSDKRRLSIDAYRALQNDFLLVSETKGMYDQIRFLNTNGQEIIRVNYNQGSSSVVPIKSLQNKGSRYYFTRSLETVRKKVYVSPLDLNMEHGKLEKPHKPMIRFGTPVFNAEDEKIGVLLFNYLAEQLLNNFSKAVANIEDHVAIVNEEGYWLKHPQSAMEWGFMLKHDHNISKVYPGSWKKILPGEDGQFTNDAGIFTFTTIHLFQTLQMHNMRKNIERKQSVENEYQWKIVSHVTRDVINAENRVILTALVKIAAPVFLLLLLLSWGLSLARVKNKQAKELLEHQATIDTLTGLPNRQLFQDRLSRALLHSKRLHCQFALLFIDLDKFKVVNDTLGHAAGDLLLQEVSMRIKQVVRESDTVARLGGDEFTVILNAIAHHDDIVRVAQLIVKVLEQPFVLGEKEANIGASIGIAVFPDDGTEDSSLLNSADSAMYQAKQSGRNRYCFFEDLIIGTSNI